ncbi:MAG: hypothetical protein HEQ39_06615 [Rhizobacter sp.]
MFVLGSSIHMLPISYKSSYAVKWGPSAILGAALCANFYYWISENPGRPAAHWVLALLSIFLFVSFVFVAGLLADEVFDCGDELLVRKGNTKERIPLESIVKVEEGYVRPNTLRLFHFTTVIVTMDRDTALGRSFSFVAPRYGLGGSYERVGVVNHLRLRAQRARQQKTA